jgi:hypothetical protein
MSTPFVRKDVDAGQYYASLKDPTWLRLVLHRHGDRVRYADFASIGECSIGTFARFTNRGPLTAEELKSHGNEIAKIEAKRFELDTEAHKLVDVVTEAMGSKREDALRVIEAVIAAGYRFKREA